MSWLVGDSRRHIFSRRGSSGITTDTLDWVNIHVYLRDRSKATLLLCFFGTICLLHLGKKFGYTPKREDAEYGSRVDPHAIVEHKQSE